MMPVRWLTSRSRTLCRACTPLALSYPSVAFASRRSGLAVTVTNRFAAESREEPVGKRWIVPVLHWHTTERHE